MKAIRFVALSLGATLLIMIVGGSVVGSIYWLMNTGTWWGLAASLFIFMTPFGGIIAAERLEKRAKA